MTQKHFFANFTRVLLNSDSLPSTHSQLYSNPILINKTKHSDNQIKIRFLEWDDLWDHDNRYPNRKWQTGQLNEYG